MRGSEQVSRMRDVRSGFLYCEELLSGRNLADGYSLSLLCFLFRERWPHLLGRTSAFNGAQLCLCLGNSVSFAATLGLDGAVKGTWLAIESIMGR